MSAAHFAQMLALAAIWGASFMFMRIAVPQLGPVWLLELRVLSACIVLLLVSLALRRALHVTRHWRHYLFLGLFNTALPFLAFAWAAQTLPASLLAVLNSTAPLWGLVIGVLWRGKPVTRRAVTGLLTGMAGVACLVGFSELALRPGNLLAVLATLGAAVCYALASSYAEYADKVETYANAHGSLWAAFLLLLPLLALSPAPASWPPGAVASGLVLGLLCTGVAYVMYFRLIDNLGAPSALSVGYLIPLWGVFWGWLFLDETIGWNTLLGAALVLTGTMLVTGFRLRQLFSRRTTTPAA